MLIKTLASVMLIMTLWEGYAKSAEKVKIGFIQASEPHVIVEGQVIKGIQPDHFRESLKLSNLELEAKVANIQRLIHEFKSKSLDCVTPLNEDTGVKGNYTKQFTTIYENAAIYLKNQKFNVKNFDDFKGRTIIAFQNASKWLQPEYQKGIKDAKRYREIDDVTSIPAMVYAQRSEAEIAVLDINMFKGQTLRLVKNKKSSLNNVKPTVADTLKNVAFKKIFKPAQFRSVCHNAAYTAAIDKGFTQIIKSGQHEAIVSKYTSD